MGQPESTTREQTVILREAAAATRKEVLLADADELAHHLDVETSRVGFGKNVLDVGLTHRSALVRESLCGA